MKNIMTILIVLALPILSQADNHQDSASAMVRTILRLENDASEFAKFIQASDPEKREFFRLIAGPVSRIKLSVIDYGVFLKCYDECNHCKACSLGLANSLCTVKFDKELMDSMISWAGTLTDYEKDVLGNLQKSILRAFYFIRLSCPVDFTCTENVMEVLQEKLYRK